MAIRSATCAYKECGKTFTTRDARSRYCCRKCVLDDARERLATLREEGNDPAHGGAAAESRRQSLARRRAAGEPLGRQATIRDTASTKRTPDTSTKPPVDTGATTTTAPKSEPIKPNHKEETAAWLRSGQRHEHTTALAISKEGNRTLVLAGFGAGIRVEKDDLIVTEGRTHHPQTAVVHTLHRGLHTVERIICIAPSGSLSFDAMRWCKEQSITLIMIDRDGCLLADIAAESSPDARLRRRQYLAADASDTSSTSCAARVAQWLIKLKLQGQRDTLVAHDLPLSERGIDVLSQAIKWFDLPTLPPWICGIDTLRLFEGRAARAYFNAWTDLPLHWKAADSKRVPPHWLCVRERTSPLSSNARRAIDPTNAISNYTYALLEGQCTQALAGAGFDLACGFLHADKDGRDSLVYDLMEPFRPHVDSLVLSLIARTVFTYGDFVTDSAGQCRLHPQLTRAVVAACRLPQARVDAGARALRALLLDGVIHEGPL